MHVNIEEDKCVGAGQCALVAPTVFDLRDEDGVAFTLHNPALPDEFDQVREAADLCPTLAIALLEGTA